MDKQQPEKNITSPEKENTVDELLLKRIRSVERRLLQNIQWVSFAIAALYLLGCIWRVSYYGQLGIPDSFLDFPFPEILIPKSFGFIVFLAWLIVPFSYKKFYRWIFETNQVRFVKSSTLFNKILWVLSCVGLAAILYTKQYRFIAFGALGYFLGEVAFKISSLSNRVQFWHVLWICFLITIGVQYLDGRMTAVSDLKNSNFPLASISVNEQEDVQGLFYGLFKGKYLVCSGNELEGIKLNIVDPDKVKNIDLRYVKWLEFALKNIEKKQRDLQKEKNKLSKEMPDSNIPHEEN